MTALSSIPDLPDGSVIPLLQGKLHTIHPIEVKHTKPDENGVTKPFQAQRYLLENASGKVMISTINKSLFVPETYVGVEVKFVSTMGDNGLRGLVKESYIQKDKVTGEEKRRTKVKAEVGALWSKVDTPQPAQPKAPPPVSLSPVQQMARDWRCCYDAAREFAPAELEPQSVISIATTLFIECQRKGTKISPPPRQAAKPQETKPEIPIAEQPKTKLMSLESLATKVIGELPITLDDLAGHDPVKVFDICYKDAQNDIPQQFLDAAHDAARERHKKDESKLYPALLCNWERYLNDARKLRDAAELEKQAVEMPMEEL